MTIKTNNKKIPMRKCVGCQEMKSKQELVRIIRTNEDEIIVDPTGRANGRGAYICKNPQCLQMAKKNKGLERSLKKQLPEEIYASLEEEMT